MTVSYPFACGSFVEYNNHLFRGAIALAPADSPGEEDDGDEDWEVLDPDDEMLNADDRDRRFDDDFEDEPAAVPEDWSLDDDEEP